MFVGVLETIGIGAVDFGTIGGEGLGNRPCILIAACLAHTIVVGGRSLQACSHILLRQNGIDKYQVLGSKIGRGGNLQDVLYIIIRHTPTQRSGMPRDVGSRQRFGRQASALAKRDVVYIPTLGIGRRESNILACCALQTEREAFPTVVRQVADRLAGSDGRIGIGERIDCHEGIGIVRVGHRTNHQQRTCRSNADLSVSLGSEGARIEINLNGVEICLQLRHSGIGTEFACVRTIKLQSTRTLVGDNDTCRSRGCGLVVAIEQGTGLLQSHCGSIVSDIPMSRDNRTNFERVLESDDTIRFYELCYRGAEGAAGGSSPKTLLIGYLDIRKVGMVRE